MQSQSCNGTNAGSHMRHGNINSITKDVDSNMLLLLLLLLLLPGVT
jgi:uncharacterized membrane protein